MGPSERRQAIWEYLCNARFSTTRQLADRFGVCERTIRSDLIALACTYPIETSFGPYGGIRVSNWYHPEQKRLSARQTSLLVRVRLTLEGEDLKGNELHPHPIRSAGKLLERWTFCGFRVPRKVNIRQRIPISWQSPGRGKAMRRMREDHLCRRKSASTTARKVRSGSI